MATTPVNIEFNAVGTQAAIAEIEAVYQRLIDARLREATVSEQSVGAEQQRTIRIQAEIEKRMAAIEKEKQIMADMLETQRRIGGSFEKGTIDSLLEPHRKFIAENEKAIQGLQGFQSAAHEAGENVKGAFKGMKDGAQHLWDETQKLSFQMFMMQMTFQQLQGLSQGFYNIALKGNEELNQSIISTQSSLVAVTDVYKNGVKIEDPTEAIQALTPAIRKAIEDIREDSLDLVGVTSDQLIPIFQILANNAGKITEQSKQWADPIEAAQKLTISFAASLGTMGIPIRQARQEIQSMLQGYIDQNSILAQQLGIKNDQIRLWQKEGVLVDELMKRMEPFVAGNKLALQTINGMIPNIKEVIDEVIRVGTEPIYEPIVKQLGKVYEWLTKNKDELVQGTTSFVDFLVGLGNELGKAFKIALDITAPLREQIANITDNLDGPILQTITDSIAGVTIVIGALLNVLDPFLMAFNAILTILNETGLMKVIGWGIAIAAVTAAVSGLITQGLLLMTFLTNIGTLMTGLAAGTIATGSAFAGLTTAWAGATAAATALNANLQAMGITLGAIAQATVILGAAMAALWVWTEGHKLQVVNEGFDKELAKSNKAYTEAMNLRSQLQKAQKDAMKDGVVTDDEQKGLDKITSEMRAKKAIIGKSIADQRALLANANDDQKDGISASIAQLTKDLASIDPDDTALKMKGISSLGDAYQKLGNDAAQALKLLRENQFTENSQSEKAAKEAIANTKQQIELGLITVEEARKRYQEISKINYLEAATRIAAEKEVTALIKLEGDQQIAILTAKREKRLIGDEEFYQKSKEIQIKTIDEQIAAEEQRMMGRDKGESYYAKIAELETKKAKIINEADQRLLQQRILQIKVSTDTLKLEIEKANTVLTSVEQGLGTENKALEVGNKAIASKKSLMESLIAVEKSYQDLSAAGYQIELSRAERSLDYYKKLQDVRIKGTALESAYQRELDKIGGYAKTEIQLLQAKQEAETKIFNAKLANLLKEQEMQRQLLDLDLQREQSQLRQNVNQEKINLLKSEQSVNEARGRILESQSTQQQTYLKLQDAIAQGKPKGEIEQLQLQFEQEQNKLRTAYQTLRFSNDSVALSQQSLKIAEDSYARSSQAAENRRTILQNQQAIARSQVSDEGNKLEAKQNIEKAELFTQKEGMFQAQALQQLTVQQGLITKDRELRLIGETEYYDRSKALSIQKTEEEIRQTKERLENIAKTDKQGREVLIGQLAELETKRAKIINDADQSLLAKRIQVVKISNDLLKIESEKTGQILTQIQSNAGLENSRFEMDNKALMQRKTLLESISAVEKSYQELISASQQVELSRADRALDYQKRLEDSKIRGTALERVYQQELDRLGDRGKNEFQLLQQKQEVEAKIYNTKLENALKEQAIQKELLEIDIQREQTQLRQAANQEKINLLTAMQSSNDAMSKVGTAQSGLMTAQLNLKNGLSQELSQEQIATLRAAQEQARIELESAKNNFALSQEKIALSQQSLQMVEENFTRSEQLAANRRQILNTQQSVARSQLYEEGEKIGAGQRIQQADLLTNRIDQYRPKPPYWEKQPLYYEKGTAYDIQTPKIKNRELIGDMPSPDMLRNLSPQSNNQVLPNQLNQIIDLMGQLKGGLGAIASTKTPVNPTINNNFNGPIDDTATMAKYRRATLEIIDNVIPKP